MWKKTQPARQLSNYSCQLKPFFAYNTAMNCLLNKHWSLLTSCDAMTFYLHAVRESGAGLSVITAYSLQIRWAPIVAQGA